MHFSTDLNCQNQLNERLTSLATSAELSPKIDQFRFLKIFGGDVISIEDDLVDKFIGDERPLVCKSSTYIASSISPRNYVDCFRDKNFQELENLNSQQNFLSNSYQRNDMSFDFFDSPWS